jgi:alkylation response protein AidB-like acyl-CoA dehydrogenase
MRDITDNEIIPNRHKFDEDWLDHKYVEPIMRDILVEKGSLQKVLFPIEYGGLEYNYLDYKPGAMLARIFEEIGRGDTAMDVAAGVTLWPLAIIGVEPLIREDLLREFAPLYCDTEEPVFGMTAMTEPQGGSDIENVDNVRGRTIKTIARLEGDEWVINGHKLWPTNSGGATKGIIAVVCTTKEGSMDPDDFAVIYVPASTKGVKQGAPYKKAGMAADKNSDIWFEDVRVPKHYRAWGPGKDMEYFRAIASWGCLGSVGFAAGAMYNICELLDDHFSERTFNGRPMKEFDAVASVMADIATDAQMTRWSLYEFAHILDTPSEYGYSYSPEVEAKARALKLWAVDTAVKDSEKAMDLLGRYGYDRERAIEKQWRDMKIIQLWMGGRQLNQMTVARWFYKCETM